jgi:hypothetical protein
MKLIGVAMVKNEADIIEAFVRHNLRYLDALVLVDHASTDATPAILQALRDEGLPLEVGRDATPAFRQGDRLTAVVRGALQRHAADWAFALDGDEFLLADSRQALRDALANCGTSSVAELPWTVYVVPEHGSDAAHPFERARLRADGRPHDAMTKVVVGRGYVEHADWMIAQGNHHVLVPDEGSWSTLPPRMLPGAGLAHLPFRSPAQFLSKILLGWFGNRLLQGPAARTSPVNWHWRELFQRWLGGTVPDWKDLQERALEWYVLKPTPQAEPLPRSAVRLTDAPLLITQPLRHTPAQPSDPLRLLAAWTEALLDAVEVR